MYHYEDGLLAYIKGPPSGVAEKSSLLNSITSLEFLQLFLLKFYDVLEQNDTRQLFQAK